MRFQNPLRDFKNPLGENYAKNPSGQSLSPPEGDFPPGGSLSSLRTTISNALGHPVLIPKSGQISRISPDIRPGYPVFCGLNAVATSRIFKIENPSTFEEVRGIFVITSKLLPSGVKKVLFCKRFCDWI